LRRIFVELACACRNRAPCGQDVGVAVATIRLTTCSPGVRRMPRTPVAVRPIERTSSFVETHGLAVRGEQHDVALAVGQLHVDQRIALIETDRDLAALQLEREFRQRRFLDRAVLRREEHEAVFGELAHRLHGLHLFVRLERQEVTIGLPRAFGPASGNWCTLSQNTRTGAGKRQQRVVSVGDPEALDEILFLHRGRRTARGRRGAARGRADRLALR
jgi:hypothetical protein